MSNNNKQTKFFFRKKYQNKRNSLSRTQVNELSRKISKKFIKKYKIFFDYFKNLNFVTTIHIFLPIHRKNEVNTHILIDMIKENIKYKNIKFVIPRMTKTKTGEKILQHYYYNQNTIIVRNKWGIMEPIENNTQLDEVNLLLIDMVIVPLLCWDIERNRIGYGGGYYDKTISYFSSIGHNFITIGLAYDEQKVGEVVHDNLDQKLNYILTEKQLYKVS